MSTAPQYLPHYSVADYKQWEGDWELWNGIPVAMAPSPFGRHQYLSLRIAQALLTAIESAKCEAVVLQEIDWIVCDDTIVRPDIVVVCNGVPEQHVTETPSLVVEILSPSTAAKDRNDKLKLYEDNGVDHYLIVDPVQNSVEQMIRDESGRFSLALVTETLQLTVCGHCRIAIDMAAIISTD